MDVIERDKLLSWGRDCKTAKELMAVAFKLPEVEWDFCHCIKCGGNFSVLEEEKFNYCPMCGEKLK